LAFATSDTRIQLNWWDYADYEDGFVIERSTDGQNFSEVGRAGENVEKFTVNGLSPGTHYWFRVKAFNGAGTSSFVDTAEETTPAAGQPAPPPPSTPAPAETPAPAIPTELLVAWYGAGSTNGSGNDFFDDIVDSVGGTINTAATDPNTGLGLPWRSGEGPDARTRLLEVIDSNHDKHITQAEVDAVRVDMLGYSWGCITAVNVARRLTDHRIGKFRLDVDIPIHALVVIDPVHHGIEALLKHTHGPVKNNVADFYNYYETREGYTNIDLYYPNSNIWAGQDPYGTFFSSLLHGDPLRSDAQRTTQVNVTTDPTYMNFEGGELYTPPGQQTQFEGRLKGKDAQHDTMPFFAYGAARIAILY
jgi:hypothetical protein